MKNLLGYFLIFIGIVIALYAAFINFKPNTKNEVFSTYTLLSSSWEKYKEEFINKDGRVIDNSQNDITTSEGQSYAMLRAVWVGDHDSFDLVWKWTRENLKRNDNNLFGWRWGKKPNGGYGFASKDDYNSAADADSDIALALIFASKRWGDNNYLEYAKQLIPDIWKYEVGSANGKNYLIAGNWAKSGTQIVVNPSYLSPFEYRIFGKIDKKNDWNSLVVSSYEILNNSSNEKLDKDKSVGLPPDWVAVNKNNGSLSKPNVPTYTTNYGYDAVRVPWRIGLDYQWFGSNDAKEYLTKNFTFLLNKYKNDGKLATVYAHDGTVVENFESPIIYATSIGFLNLIDKKLSAKVYQTKILTLYSNDTNSFNSKLPEYEQNWIWFGAAFYNNQLKNYYE